MNPRHLSIAADPSGEIWIVRQIKRLLGCPPRAVTHAEVSDALDDLSVLLEDLGLLCRRETGARQRVAIRKFDHAEWLLLALEGEAIDAGIFDEVRFADGARARITVEVV